MTLVSFCCPVPVRLRSEFPWSLLGVGVGGRGSATPLWPSSLSVTETSDESAQCFSAMHHGESEPEADQSDTEGNEAFPVSLLSVSCSELVAEQRADPSLS